MNPEYTIIVINWLTAFFRENDLLIALTILLFLALSGMIFFSWLGYRALFNRIGVCDE